MKSGLRIPSSLQVFATAGGSDGLTGPTATHGERPMAQVKSRDGLLGWIRQAFRSEKERAAGDTIIKRRPRAIGVRAADWEYQTRIAAMIRGDAWIRLMTGGRGQGATIGQQRRRGLRRQVD